VTLSNSNTFLGLVIMLSNECMRDDNALVRRCKLADSIIRTLYGEDSTSWKPRSVSNLAAFVRSLAWRIRIALPGVALS